MSHCTMLHVAVLLLLGLLSLASTAPNAKLCAENGNPCANNLDCCGGCCQDSKCVPYSDACSVAHSPCHLYDCPPNKVCYLQNVECLQSPCKPIPACKADDIDYN